MRVMLYDASWRLLESRIDTDFDPEETSPDFEEHAQLVWGLRYIDDIVSTRRDLNPSEEDGAEVRMFHATDAQFSSVAILLDNGSLLERVAYSPYGVARHQWPADASGDGAVNSTDLSIVLSAYGAITSGNYKSEADFNRDGVVNASDLAAVLAYAAALPEGTLSSPAIDNRTGYCGYRFAPEPEMYLARNRWLSPPLGRWIQRDPLGYVDGLNLGEYANSSPLVSNDPYGEEMHHLVPVQSIKDLLGRGLLDPELGREMKRYGDSRWTINAPSHRGSHPEYTKAVNGIIEAYVRRNGGRPLTRGDMERIQRLILQSNDEEIVKHFRKWGVRVTVRVISGDISMLSRLGGSAGSAAGGGAFLYGAYAAAMLYLAGEAAGAGIEMVGHYATCCSCLAEKDTAPKTKMSLSGITVDFWTVSHSGIGEVLCMEERGGSSKLLVGYEAPGILWGKEEFRWRPCERGGR